MSADHPHLIADANLSHAWGRALLYLMETPRDNFAPLVISLTGFEANTPTEDPEIRAAVDAHLASNGKFSVQQTAMTIFPHRSWSRRDKTDRQQFYDYAIKKLLPRLKARSELNRRGTYFERMMDFQGVKKGQITVINQLEFVIELMKKGQEAGRRPRQSALQISCIDPAKDHLGSSRQGFPCLQQVSISYDGTHGLALSAYYPTQFIFDRGYGNYLGLCQLAEFIAHSVSLSVVRVNFFITNPELGTDENGSTISKRQLQPLAETVANVIGEIAT